MLEEDIVLSLCNATSAADVATDVAALELPETQVELVHQQLDYQKQWLNCNQ